MRKNLTTLLMLCLLLILSQSPAHANGLKRGALGLLKNAIVRPIGWTALAIHVLSGMAESKLNDMIIQDRLREADAEPAQPAQVEP